MIEAMYRCMKSVFVAMLLSVYATQTALAQPTPTQLQPPTHHVDYEFRRITSTRQLSDGTLLVVDGYANDIVAIDWSELSARVVGRKGRGPGEYLEVNRIFPWFGDSSILEDPNTRRWILMGPDRVLDAMNPTGEYAVQISLAGYDASGRHVEVHPFKTVKPPGWVAAPPLFMAAESLLVVARMESTRRSDTVAIIAGEYGGIARHTKSVPEGKMNFMVSAPFAAADQAYLFFDGWVAIARRHPYRVDWVSPTGQHVRDKPLPFEAVPVDARQKQAFLNRKYTGGLQGKFTADEMPSWPKVLPPFQRQALVPLASGAIAVERTLNPLQPGRYYDIVDRTGRLAQRLVMPSSQRIVGFGDGVVYTVSIDDDELETIQRHPWP